MTFAQAAQKAIELGGKYDGHEPPEDINACTKTSVDRPGRPGPDGRGADNYPRDGQTQSFVVGFAEVEVDVETGQYQDPRIRGRRRRRHGHQPAQPARARPSAASMLGIGHAIAQKWVYDQHYGVPLAKRFHYNKPPTILDEPRT